MLFLQPGLLFPPSPGKLLCMLQYPILQETSLNTQLYQAPPLYPSAHATPLQPWPVSAECLVMCLSPLLGCESGWGVGSVLITTVSPVPSMGL